MRLFLFSALFLALALCPSSASTPILPGLAPLITSSSRFSILVDLLKFTNLLDTVVTTPDLTIFAPTNHAFRKSVGGLGCTDGKSAAGIVHCIKSRFGRVYVGNILLYHGVPGVLNSDAVLTKTTFDTVNGQTFCRDGLTLIDNVADNTNPKLIAPLLNLRYDKGIVHGISRVLLPTPNKAPGIVAVASGAKIFNIFLSLLVKTGLASSVAEASYITLFAPTDHAFKATARIVGCKVYKRTTADAVAECLIKTLTMDGVKLTLAYHIVPGLYTSERVLQYNTFNTAVELPFFRKKFKLIDQAPVLGNPRLIKRLLDVQFDNGIVHGISKVLIPFNTGTGSACDQFEYPISMANGQFIPLHQLLTKARKCRAVRMAVSKCHVSGKEVCYARAARVRVYHRVSIGVVVAATKKCKTVAKAVRMCKY